MVRWLGLAIAILVAFLVGQVEGSLALGAMQPAPHPVTIEIAGPDISGGGGRKVEVSTDAIETLQVCVDACDEVAIGYQADGRQEVHLRATNADGACVACSAAAIGDRKTLRLARAS
jgi:hypothetical protein